MWANKTQRKRYNAQRRRRLAAMVPEERAQYNAKRNAQKRRWLAALTPKERAQYNARRRRGGRRGDGRFHHPLYNIWRGMIYRCTTPSKRDVRWYRGVKVCKRWRNSLATFAADMGPRPGPEYSLDRYPNPDGDYKPSNCRWATPPQQARNRRHNNMPRPVNKLKTKGVDRHGNGYRVVIYVHGKQKYLGTFPTIAQASAAYKRAARKAFGRAA